MRVCSTEFLGYAGFQVLHEVAFTGPELLLPRVALAPGLLLPRVALCICRWRGHSKRCHLPRGCIEQSSRWGARA